MPFFLALKIISCKNSRNQETAHILGLVSIQPIPLCYPGGLAV